MEDPSQAASHLVNPAASEIATYLVQIVNSTFVLASQVYDVIPGSKIVYRYVQASHQNDPFRTLLEACLLVFLMWYFLHGKYKIGKKELPLTEKEIQELIDEWEPEPLVPEPTDFQKQELERTPVIFGPAGLRCKGVDGREKLNFASFNFLGLMNSESVKEKAVAALRKYGVGSCGPPGFYGTIDVHVQLEEQIARFIGAEAAIIYSQGFSCVSSTIPAFAKRGDVLVVDEGVNFAVQKGCQISRSQIKYFKHNDMADLERVLAQVHKTQSRSNQLTRRFLIVEGLYANSADMCPLPEIVALKDKYKFRLILEESMAFGTVGPRGAGTADFYGISPADIDITIASMANALAASGGFCAGTKEICEHQRLSGQAYTFSASLPAILAVAAIDAIQHLDNNPETLTKLRENATVMKTALDKIPSICPGVPLSIVGDDISPFFHIQLSLNTGNREDDERILQEIVDTASREGVLLTRAKYVSSQESHLPPASIRVAVSAGFTKREIERVATVIRDSVRRVVKLRIK